MIQNRASEQKVDHGSDSESTSAYLHSLNADDMPTIPSYHPLPPMPNVVPLEQKMHATTSKMWLLAFRLQGCHKWRFGARTGRYGGVMGMSPAFLLQGDHEVLCHICERNGTAVQQCLFGLLDSGLE